MPICEHVVADYQTTRLSLKAHPMSFLRRSMAKQGYTACAGLDHMRNGQSVKLAGIVLIRQRPGSAKGVCFITVEDETGVANLVVWPKVMEALRIVIMRARVIDVRCVVQRSEDVIGPMGLSAYRMVCMRARGSDVRGYVQRDADVIHLVAHQLTDRSDALEALSNDPLEPPLAHADEVKKNIPHDPRGRHPRDVRVIPKSRDFH